MRRGPTAEVILARAAEERWDVIVMMSHGQHGFMRSRSAA
jgi:nucleotide-binding universal stress UspA family protein